MRHGVLISIQGKVDNARCNCAKVLPKNLDLGTFIAQLGVLVWAGSDPRLYFPCLLSRDIHCIQDRTQDPQLQGSSI